jgi:hypothetical protein
VARRCSRNLPGSYADSIGLGCHGHADCDEYEEMASGINLTEGQPSNLPDVTVTEDASASFRGIDRSVDVRRGQWSTQRTNDVVDALEYAWWHVWGRRETQSTVGRVQSFPPGQYEASMAATHAVRAMLAIASAGVAAIAAARRLAEREGGWRALTALGAIGRGIALPLESNYGSTLRGALLEIERSVAVPVADLTPTRGALLEFR